MTRLRSVADVMRVLGDEEVQRLCKANSKQIWNWTGRYQQFPARTYVALTRALARRGYTAPARLWSMVGVEDEEEAA